MIYVHVGGLGLLWVVLGCIIGEARREKGGWIQYWKGSIFIHAHGKLQVLNCFFKAKNSLECLPLTSSLALGDGDIYGIGCNNYVE